MDEIATPPPMTKRIAELLPTVDVLVLNRLGAQWPFIDPALLGPDVVEHLRPVGVGDGRIFLAIGARAGRDICHSLVAPSQVRKRTHGRPRVAAGLS